MEGAESNKTDKKDKDSVKPLTRLSGNKVLFTARDLETIEIEARKKRAAVRKSKSDSLVTQSKQGLLRKDTSPVLRPAKLQLHSTPTSSAEKVGENPFVSFGAQEVEKGDFLQPDQLKTPIPPSLPPLSQHFAGETQGTQEFRTCDNTISAENLGQKLKKFSQGLSLPTEGPSSSGELSDSLLLEPVPGQVKDSCTFLEKISEKTVEDSLSTSPEGSPVLKQRSSQPLLSLHFGTGAPDYSPRGEQIICTNPEVGGQEQDQQGRHLTAVQEIAGARELHSLSSHSASHKPVIGEGQSRVQSDLSADMNPSNPGDENPQGLLKEEVGHATNWLQNRFGNDFQQIPDAKKIALRNHCVKREIATHRISDYLKDFHQRLQPLKEQFSKKENVPKSKVLAEREAAKIGRNLLSELDKAHTEALEILESYGAGEPVTKAISSQLSKEVQGLRDDWLQGYADFEQLNVESDRQEEQISSAQSKLPATSLKPPFDGTPRNYPTWRERKPSFSLSQIWLRH